MSSYAVSESQPLPAAALRQIAEAGPLDEISNAAGAVRHHLFWHGRRDRVTNRLHSPVLFFVYQTGRHGPQNGFRMVLVRRGYRVESPTKPDGDGAEDDIDRLEKDIPQGHMEVVILGEEPPVENEEEGSE